MENMPPLVSIIVPVYNVADFVETALTSVLTQTHQNWECIVIDDGSTDGSGDRALRVVERDARMRMVRQENRGLSAARNTGLRAMSSDSSYVAFLDSDDTWTPDALEVLVRALREDETAAGSYGLAENIDALGNPLLPGQHAAAQRDRRRVSGRRLQPVTATEPLTFAEAVVVSPLYPPAVGLHRRSVVDAVGFFDERLAQLEDWDYYLRAMRHGHYVALDVLVAHYRKHGAQMTRRTVEHVVALDQVRRKTWESTENSEEQRRNATVAWRQLQARRTFRSLQRTLGSLRQRDFPRFARLSAATAVLTAQNVLPGPPTSSPTIVRWSERKL
ncbi:glycosyltransferase family 2 protein [Kineococcus sp. SYSU DK005]|uniref:glycosyltransferase family 2 protein n=1 Tax=Kineococcus sp. SYSU DK005 TaxID=3383126 RepID=UPI003D7E7D4E